MVKSRRSLRWLRALAILGGSLLLGYLAGANVFLAIGLRRIVSQPTRAFTYASAWTVWPGSVHVRDFRIAAQSDTVEWALTSTRATVDLELTALLHREVHLTHVHADGLTFRFRLRAMPERTADAKVAAQPPIPPFEDPPIRIAGAPMPEILGGSYRSWVTRVDASDAEVSEIWIGPYRFEGHARSRGGFSIEPHRAIGVGPAVVDIGGGALSVGGRVIAQAIEGGVTCDVERFNPDERPGWEMLHAFSSSANVVAEVPSLRFLGFFVPEDRVRFDEGAGKTQVAVRLEQGRFAPASAISFATDRVRVTAQGFEGVSDARLRWQVADDGQTVVETRSAESSVTRSETSVPPVRIVDGSATFRTLDGDVASGLRFGGLSANLPHVDMPDIRWLTGARRGARVRFDGGHVTVAAKLDVDAAFHVRGDTSVAVAGANLVVRDSLLRANLSASATLDGDDVRATRRVAIKHGTVALSHGGVWRGGDMTPLAARVDVDGGELAYKDAFGFKLASHAAVTGTNAVLDLVGAPRLAKFAADLLSSSRATSYARLAFDAGLLTVKLTDGASGAARVNGELQRSPDATDAAFVVYALGLSVGLRAHDGKLDTVLEPGDRWLEENRPTLAPRGRRVARAAEPVGGRPVEHPPVSSAERGTP